MIRLFIADDHEIVRVGLRELFELHADIQIVGEAADGPAVLSAYQPGAWDVLLLDLTLPRVNGLSVLRQLRARDPGLVILILSMYPEDQYGPRLLGEGASGYLSKDRSGAEIAAAVRTAASTGRFVTDEVAQRMTPRPIRVPPHESLLPRELQVFLLLSQGRTADSIATELGLEPAAVEILLGRIQSQLGVSSLTEVVRYAREAGIVG